MLVFFVGTGASVPSLADPGRRVSTSFDRLLYCNELPASAEWPAVHHTDAVSVPGRCGGPVIPRLLGLIDTLTAERSGLGFAVRCHPDDRVNQRIEAVVGIEGFDAREHVRDAFVGVAADPPYEKSSLTIARSA